MPRTAKLDESVGQIGKPLLRADAGEVSDCERLVLWIGRFSHIVRGNPQPHYAHVLCR